MIGKLLSGAIKLVTLPVDVIEIGADLMTGGNGDRRGLKDVVPMASNLRDAVCKTIEKIDD
jgi:hypothetical protein